MNIFIDASATKTGSNFKVDTSTGKFSYRFSKVWHNITVNGGFSDVLIVDGNVESSSGTISDNSVFKGGIAFGIGNSVNANYNTPDLKANFGFAAGYNCSVSGFCGFAFGSQNTVSGLNSGAIGSQNTVSGVCSYAIGSNLKVAGAGAIAIGKYNDDSSEFIFQVGQGTAENSRLNVFTIDNAGNATAAGDVKADDFQVGDMSLPDEIADLKAYGLQWVNTMPTASEAYEGIVFLFIGTTTSDYTTSHFYQCRENGGSYSWVDLNI